MTRSNWLMGAGSAAFGGIVLCAVLAACGADETTGTGGAPVTVAPPGTAGVGGGFAGAAGVPAAGVGAAGQAGASALPGAAGTGTVGTGSGSAGAAGSGTAGAAGGAPAGTGGLGGAGMAGGAGAGGSVAPPPVTGDLCERWTAAHANPSEGAWNGNAAGCEAGEMSEAALATAHALHSLYREMAGLEPVEMTAEGNRLAQGCALLMAANGRISHTPDSSWTCYTAEAADTASKSSLSGGSAISSVDGYVIDPGNNTTLGHRRWVLSNMLAGVGFGSTGNFSCQYQPPQRAAPGAKAWVAWPPPGQVPIESFGSRFATIDQTGWSVQSDTINLQNAQVKVTSGGMDLAVTVMSLPGGYGSTYALRIVPMGWTTAAGKTYHVELSGTSMPIAYDVEVVDCP